MKNYRLLLIVMLVAVFAGCATPTPASTPTLVAVTPEKVVTPVDLALDVAPETVEELRLAGAATIVDVREISEYDTGHIPGAVLIPLGELPNRLDEVPTDVPVVMVCRSGNRSTQALQLLQKEGFTNVHNMVGGMNAWAAAGYEIEAVR